MQWWALRKCVVPPVSSTHSDDGGALVRQAAADVKCGFVCIAVHNAVANVDVDLCALLANIQPPQCQALHEPGDCGREGEGESEGGSSVWRSHTCSFASAAYPA